MEKDKLSTELFSLERRVKLLLAEVKSSKQEIESLRDENLRLRDLLQQREQQVDSFQNKINISTIADRLVAGENNSTELRAKIDEYIVEIDRCIAHLSK